MSDDEELQRLREAALRSKKNFLTRKGNNSVPNNLVDLSKDNCSNPAALLNKDVSLTAFTHEDWRSGFIESIKRNKPKNFSITQFIPPSVPQSLPSHFTQSFITSCITTSTIQHSQVFTNPLSNELPKYPQPILVPQQPVILQQPLKPIKNAGFLLNPQGIPVLKPFIQPPTISHQTTLPIYPQKTSFYTHSPHRKHYTRLPNDKVKSIPKQRSNLIVVPVDNSQQTPSKSEANVKTVHVDKVIVSTASSSVSSSFSRPQDKWSNTKTKLEEKSYSKSKKSKFDRFDDSATSDDDDNDEDEEEEKDGACKNDKNGHEFDDIKEKTEEKVVEKNELYIFVPKVISENKNDNNGNDTKGESNNNNNKKNKWEPIEKHKNIPIKPKKRDKCVHEKNVNNNNNNANNNSVYLYNDNNNIIPYSTNNVINSFKNTFMQSYNGNNNLLYIYSNNTTDDAYISPCTSDEEEVIKKYTSDLNTKYDHVEDKNNKKEECIKVKTDLNDDDKPSYKTDSNSVDANIRSKKIVVPKINSLKNQKRSNSVNNPSKRESVRRLKSPGSLGSHSEVKTRKYVEENASSKDKAGCFRNCSDEEDDNREAYVDKASMISEKSDVRRRKRRSRSKEHYEFQDRKIYEGKGRRSYDERSRYSQMSDDRGRDKRDRKDRYKYSPIPYNYSEPHLSMRDSHHESLYRHRHSKRFASDKYGKNHRDYYNGNYYDFRNRSISPEAERVVLRVSEKKDRHYDDYDHKRDCYTGIYEDYSLSHHHFKYHPHPHHGYDYRKEICVDKYKRHKEYNEYYEDMQCFNERYNRETNVYNGRSHKSKESYERAANGKYSRKRTRSNSKENEKSSSGCKELKSGKAYEKHGAGFRNHRKEYHRTPGDANDDKHSNTKIKKISETCDNADNPQKSEKKSLSNIDKKNDNNNNNNKKYQEISMQKIVEDHSHMDKNEQTKTKENKEKTEDNILPESCAPHKGRRVVRRRDDNDTKDEKTLEIGTVVDKNDNGKDEHFTPSKVPFKSSVHERLGSKQRWKHKNTRKKTDLRNRIYERTKPSYL